MILKSLNRYLSLIIILSISPLLAEDQIDIWNKKNKKEDTQLGDTNTSESNSSSIFKTLKKETNSNQIKIDEKITNNPEDSNILGVYDPAENDFNLNMWSKTNADNVRSSVSRINKIKLSKTSQNLFEKTIFSFAYPPKGMSDEEFTNIKVNWMINSKNSELVEKFLSQNNSFHNKKKVIQYLVDSNIAKANIKASCDKMSFIDKNLKDSYLEKFKIYCIVFNDKNNEAQLLYDIFKEQYKIDNFFDDKINFLLGIKKETNKKIKDDNLLNFYLSSITIKNFKYEPNKNTKKFIWEYLNAANLIKFEDVEDKEKLKGLEIAANQDQFNKVRIFDIYKKIPFELVNLINAENIYQTLNTVDARALIYQKYLLSDNYENKIKLLFLLKELFEKDKLINVYSKFLSDRLQEIDSKNIPDAFKEIVARNIISEEEYNLGKIKYDDKILHRSKAIKFYTENADRKKIQKDFNKIIKKIKKNRKYFYSAKDIALVESLQNDGLIIPDDLKIEELRNKYDIPSSLLQLAKNDEPAFLTLKIVEIIGEDEPYQLDPETIYFITHLLNQTNLKKLRNEILVSALPQRT